MVLDLIFANAWHFLREAAPWLLIGFFFAGFLRAFFPSDMFGRMLGDTGMKQILMATAIGIPLPLCSCGVIPMGISMFKQGASRAATLAFFVATPSTTVTTVLLSAGMLGWKFTAAMIILCFSVAICTGISASLILDKKMRENERDVREGDENHDVVCACSAGACERNEHERNEHKIIKIFEYGIDEVEDIGLLILLGIFLAALVSALLPDISFGVGGGVVVPMILMLIVGMPMYVCSTASIPFVDALISKGLHPCVGLVFLVAGPATNISTMLVIWRKMGIGTAVLYVTSIISFTLMTAYMLHSLWNL